ncbi:hypothetical protein BC830DRAFT_1100997 [Chytriomyces sp. MP71]|nr:hypothetical protein BC830DRAFT_1100997 [Chytriomyces sp. MP71]
MTSVLTMATALAALVSAMPQAPALSTGSDCSILATGVLYQWGYNAPTDTKDSCCTNSLSQSGKVTCAADGQTITALSFPNAGLAGQVPGALSLLKSLTSLDISNNPGVTLGLQTLAGLPALTNLNIAGCGFTGPAIPFPSTLTCNLGTSLCGNPGCKLVNPLPACR